MFRRAPVNRGSAVGEHPRQRARPVGEHVAVVVVAVRVRAHGGQPIPRGLVDVRALPRLLGDVTQHVVLQAPALRDPCRCAQPVRTSYVKVSLCPGSVFRVAPSK